jgi:hypothetical protein
LFIRSLYTEQLYPCALWIILCAKKLSDPQEKIMSAYSLLCKKHFINMLLFAFFTAVLADPSLLLASDRSDATALRERCEAEVKVLEIAVKNFGSEKDLKDFQDGIHLIKTGKVKIAQSKYLEAITKYNEYLKLHHKIYKSLASIYIARTEQLYNDVAAELVDFIDNEKVGQYLKLANQNLADAKARDLSENFKLAVDLCRNAKKYSLDCYKAANKEIPEKYKKDLKDINKEIYKGA